MPKSKSGRKKSDRKHDDIYRNVSLKEVFQKAPGLIYIRDQKTRGIVWCNKKTEEAFGFTQKEIIALGKDIFPIIVHPDDFHLPEFSSVHYTHSNENFGGVIRVKANGKDEYKWLVGVSTIFRWDDDGHPWQTLCVFFDFTTILHTQPQLSEVLKHALNIKYKSVQELLTDREKEIVQLITAGYSNKKIAEKLFLSQFTVEGYRKNIRLKMGVKSTAQLVALAKQIGLG